MFNIKLSDIVNTKAQTNAYIAFLIAIIGLYFYEFKKLLPFLVPSIFGVPTIIGNQTDKIILNSNNTIYNDVLNSFNLSNIDIYFLNYLQIETLGEALYTYAAPLLIICSMILLLAMMAPIFISGKFKHNSDNVNNINNDKDNNNDNINN
jgi:NADH-ubiquinone oxidoreductase chain 6